MSENQQAVTYHVWTDNPNLHRQMVPDLKFPWRIQRLCGSPFVHFWMLEEITRGYQQFVDDYSGMTLVGVDVCVPKNTLDRLEKLYVESVPPMERDRNPDFLKALGTWLTDQANSYLNPYRRKVERNNWPDICVRCISEEWDEKFESHSYLHLPEDGWERISAFLTGNSISSDAAPVFWIRFQDPKKWGNNTPVLKVLAPSILSDYGLAGNEKDRVLIPVENKSKIIGSQIFSLPDKNIMELLPLVAGEHIDVVSMIFPSFDYAQLWIRHRGFHQTWVIKGTKWSQVPRGAWFPLEARNRVVLGRIINTSSGYAILGGSLILGVDELTGEN